MSNDIANQLLLRIQSEIEKNISAVKKQLMEWLERPESGGVASFCEQLKEVSGSLALLGKKNAAQLSQDIVDSISLLNDQFIKQQIDFERFSSIGEMIASGVLGLADYVGNLTDLNPEDESAIDKFSQSLKNAFEAEGKSLDLQGKVDHATYSILADKVSEIIRSNRSQIEQYLLNNGDQLNIDEIVAQNNYLINLFSILEIQAPQILLKQINQMLSASLTEVQWIDVAEAMIIVEETLSFAKSDLKNEEPSQEFSTLLAEQSIFARRREVRSLLINTGEMARVFFENVRKNAMQQERIESVGDWPEIAVRTFYFASTMYFVREHNLANALKKLSEVFAEISLRKTHEASAFPSLIDALVAVEYIFSDLADSAVLNDSDVRYLMQATKKLEEQYPISKEARSYIANFIKSNSKEQEQEQLDTLSDSLADLDSLDSDFDGYIQEQSKPLEVEHEKRETADLEKQTIANHSPSLAESFGELDNSFATVGQNLSSQDKVGGGDIFDGFTGLEDSEISEAIGSSRSLDAFASSNSDKKDSTEQKVGGYSPYFASKSLDDFSSLNVPENKKEFVDKSDESLMDDEIREFFLEELQEKIEEIQNQLPVWKENIADQDCLTTVRRAFHTIKGSGRTVGLESLGECAWQHEKMLNHVIDHSYSIHPIILDLIADTVALLETLNKGDEFIEHKAALLLQASMAEKLDAYLVEHPDASELAISQTLKELRAELFAEEYSNEENQTTSVDSETAFDQTDALDFSATSDESAEKATVGASQDAAAETAFDQTDALDFSATSDESAEKATVGASQGAAAETAFDQTDALDFSATSDESAEKATVGASQGAAAETAFDQTDALDFSATSDESAEKATVGASQGAAAETAFDQTDALDFSATSAESAEKATVGASAIMKEKSDDAGKVAADHAQIANEIGAQEESLFFDPSEEEFSSAQSALAQPTKSVSDTKKSLGLSPQHVAQLLEDALEDGVAVSELSAFAGRLASTLADKIKGEDRAALGAQLAMQAQSSDSPENYQALAQAFMAQLQGGAKVDNDILDLAAQLRSLTTDAENAAFNKENLVQAIAEKLARSSFSLSHKDDLQNLRSTMQQALEQQGEHLEEGSLLGEALDKLQTQFEKSGAFTEEGSHAYQHMAELIERSLSAKPIDEEDEEVLAQQIAQEFIALGKDAHNEEDVAELRTVLSTYASKEFDQDDYQRLLDRILQQVVLPHADRHLVDDFFASKPLTIDTTPASILEEKYQQGLAEESHQLEKEEAVSTTVSADAESKADEALGTVSADAESKAGEALGTVSAGAESKAGEALGTVGVDAESKADEALGTVSADAESKAGEALGTVGVDAESKAGEALGTVSAGAESKAGEALGTVGVDAESKAGEALGTVSAGAESKAGEALGTVGADAESKADEALDTVSADAESKAGEALGTVGADAESKADEALSTVSAAETTEEDLSLAADVLNKMQMAAPSESTAQTVEGEIALDSEKLDSLDASKALGGVDKASNAPRTSVNTAPSASSSLLSQRLSDELSKISSHPTLSDAIEGDISSSKAQDRNLSKFLSAIDSFESLSKQAEKDASPELVDKLLDSIYDIEDSLEAGNVPDWIWRMLDAIEQLLLTHRSQSKGFTVNAASILRNNIHLIENFDETGSEEDAEQAINNLLQIRKDLRGQTATENAVDGLEEPLMKEAPASSVAPVAQSWNEWIADPNAGTELVETFIDEALLLLGRSQVEAENWDQNRENLMPLEAIRRDMHTLKGGARMSGYFAIGDLTHAIESMIESIIEGKSEGNNQASAILMGALWQVLVMLDSIRDGYLPQTDPYMLNNINRFLGLPLPYPEIAEQEVRMREQTLAEPQFVPKEETPEPEIEEEIDTGFDENIDPVLVDIFSDEAQELIDQAGGLLEHNLKDKAIIEQLKRAMHTLKGGARMVGLLAIGDTSHLMESVIEKLPDYNVEQMKEAKTLLGYGHEALYNMLDNVLRREMPTPANSLNDSLTIFAKEGRFVQPEMALNVSDEKLESEQPLESFAPQAEDDASASAEKTSISEPKTSTPEKDSSMDEARSTPEKAQTESSLSDSEQVKEESKTAEKESDKPIDKPGDKARKDGSAISEVQRFVRVDASVLDDMVAMMGETAIIRSRLENVSSDSTFNLNELTRIASRIDEQMRRLDNETEAQMLFRRESQVQDDEHFDPLEMDRFSEIQQLSRQLAEAINDLKNVQETLAHENNLIRNLSVQQGVIQRSIQDHLLATQLVRFDMHEARLNRLVRQTAKSVGKEVELVIEGGQVELERRLIEDILPAIEHMIRNSIGHGLETVPERRIAGKSDTGIIKISVEAYAGNVSIRILDDGRGFDYDRIREKARSKGILDESRANDLQYLNHLMMRSGFSTAKAVTQLSGRGVGMDVVNEIVSQRRGQLRAESIPGKGAEFTILLPFTMSISEVLLVEIAGHQYVIPMTAIAAVQQVSREELLRSHQGEAVYSQYGDMSYRLYVLGQYFDPQNYEFALEASTAPVLFVNAGGEPTAFYVDHISNRLEVIVKNVNRQVLNIPGISGATILGDGNVVPVLELLDLSRRMMDLSTKGTVVEEVVEDYVPSILVVDDSVTMRKVSTRLLERNGYIVQTAKDGLDAIDVLQTFTPDLILLDIEMPRMDGFEFASHVRQGSSVAEIPIIMVTSRTGDKHRERAMQIGVQGYLGKPYREDILIETIESLLGEAKHE